MDLARSTFIRIVILGSGLAISALPSELLAFQTRTHDRINQAAAAGSTIGGDSLSQYLQDRLGFTEGLATIIDGLTSVAWIGRGGVAEDEFLGDSDVLGVIRSVNHFHTPLLPWSDAGLPSFGPFTTVSSVRWGQNPNQLRGGNASWGDARAAFFDALTLRADAQRERAYARTFQILGQVMHLVADLGSVPHTRNDPHPVGGNFETFMGMRENERLITGFQPFDRSILDLPLPTGETIARVRIARIWDADRYGGTNPHVTTDMSIGLAEFSSANFFSEETISMRVADDPDLPFPAIERLILAGPPEVYPPSPTGERRQYLKKPGDGVPVDHMVAEGVFERFTPMPHRVNYVLDDLVYTDYAAELLPRAIGYASGILDYFFRGRIDLVPDPANPRASVIENQGDEVMDGVFTLYYDDVDEERTELLTTAPVALGPGMRLPFPFTPPTNPRSPGEYTLVFKGRLGLEGEPSDATYFAVVGKQVVLAPASGRIQTSGGDAFGFAAPGRGGDVTLEAGAVLGAFPASEGELVVDAGETMTLGGGERSFTRIEVRGTLEVSDDAVLDSSRPVTITGRIAAARTDGSGANLTIQSLGRILVTGEIDTSGRNGVDIGPEPQSGGAGGNVIILSASPVPLVVPTIITFGGDAHLTDVRTLATAFRGAPGGDVTVMTHGADVFFAGERRPNTEVDPLPPHTHIAPSTTNFRRGILTTGGYGGIFGGPLGLTVNGAPGGEGGALMVLCMEPALLRFDDTQIFTGGNVDFNLGYSTAIVRQAGGMPSFNVLIQPTGSLGGRGSPGGSTANGGSGGAGGAAGIVFVDPRCSLAPAPASFRSPASTARFRRSGSDPRNFALFDRPAVVEALDAHGNRHYALQAFGGGAGIPGGSALSRGHCSITNAPCFTDDPTTCPPTPQSQICLGDAAGDPGRFGVQGAIGAVSCDALMIPATQRSGLSCQ